MRVLTVGNMYPPHHLGGYELAWSSAVSALQARGHEVRVLTTDHRQPGVSQDAGSQPHVARELRWYWHDHEFPPLSPPARLRLEQDNRAVFRRHLRELRPDVVAWWPMGGMSLSLIGQSARASVPSVGFVHDDWLVYGTQTDAWVRMFRGRRRRWLGAAVQSVTGIPTRCEAASVAAWQFVSRTTLERAREAGWTLRDVEVSPSGIDERYLDATAPAAPWGWRLLYVGRIDGRKGIDTAVGALAHLPPSAQLRIVGDGDSRESSALAAQVRELGLDSRVSIEPGRPRAELPALYAQADAVVFPVRWAEPWGLVPLEAMAIGRPVVATGRGGSGEYLSDGANCVLFEAGSDSGLADAVLRLAEDPALRERLRAGGLQTAARFTERRLNETVEQTLLRVCGRASTR